MFKDEFQRAPIDTCEYIWEAGVGFSQSSPHNFHHDYNRIEILKLLLTAFSENVYLPPLGKSNVFELSSSCQFIF
jgi:hypothetical protein